MKKEQKLAFKYGQMACASACPLASCYYPSMYELIREARNDADNRRNQENIQAWYVGYLTQTALDGNGIPQKMFSAALTVLLGSEAKSASKWIDFATECVDLGRYVDFAKVEDHSVAVNRWLETLLSGLLEVQKRYSTSIAKQVCDLALLPNCLYPSEMLQAAVHFQNGGNLKEIIKMIESGAIEGAEPFFPKFTDEAGENHKCDSHVSNGWKTFI